MRHLVTALATLLLLTGCSAGEPAAAPQPESASAAPQDAPAERIAALTYETAELVAALGEGDRLVLVPEALTNPALAADPELMGEVPHHIPVESKLAAEDVLAAEPDLVLLSARHGMTDDLADVITGAGIPVVSIDNHWQSLAEVRANISLVGEALDTPDRAAELVAELDDGLTAVTPSGEAPGVLVLSNQAGQPFVTAGEAFPLELVRLAGGRDASAELGIARSGPITAEQVIAAEPDAILLLDMNGSGTAIFEPLLANPAVAALPAADPERTLLLPGREVQALGLTDAVTGHEQLSEWLGGLDG